MVAFVSHGKTPPQPLPTRGRGLTRLRPLQRVEIQFSRHGFSPLVGEMAGRPEGVFLHEALP
ncbi:hypothetical protein CPJ18_12535 [Agrobacterium rosae]|uniref:Uncharacterized protein n=1 Tax=Agrobacterium rosae TaxID=1972867 RepID=A0AAE5RXE0_9HYPH|nr:hypothetical protein DXM21_05700 [Agrobacterium rosae]KAA3522959.1 hypothetical protein DXM25_05705 [Agrobacterium rosae]MQB47663.1 hypothetical protein [Agrobacterium rosae]POO51347.1 hypothetical protein CPJ18_12535 [Agrobacterium rosae]